MSNIKARSVVLTLMEALVGTADATARKGFRDRYLSAVRSSCEVSWTGSSEILLGFEFGLEFLGSV